MSSAETIVTDACGALNLIDLAETAPDPVIMDKGLRLLSRMVNSWVALGLNTADKTLTGTFTAGEKTVVISDDFDTSELAPGMNVAAAGLSGRIKSIDNIRQITLDTAATLNGSLVSISFTVFPIEAKFEEGVVALLALRLASPGGVTAIPPEVVMQARTGWEALCANFMPIPIATYDRGVIYTTSTQRSIFYDGQNG